MLCVKALILCILEFPLEPSSPKASEIQAYAMRLIWDAPADGGSPLTGYNVLLLDAKVCSKSKEKASRFGNEDIRMTLLILLWCLYC